MILFKEFIKNNLTEHILSIGINDKHDSYREKLRDQIFTILHNSYKKVEGGYSGMGSGSEEESETINKDISNLFIKATLRNGKVTAVSLYKNLHGRKLVALGTDGTEQGKKDYIKTSLEDHNFERSWAEVSGAIERFHSKIGSPKISGDQAEKILNKKILKVHDDKYHYDRIIGKDVHTKIMTGFPKF